MRFRSALLAGLACCGLAAALGAEDFRLLNPTGDRSGEVLRLKNPVPGPAGSFIVKEDGKEIPYLVEEIGGRKWIWVRTDFAANSSHTYETAPGTPAKVEPLVKVRKEGAVYILDNDAVAVQLPAEGAGAPPGPIAGLRLGEKWIGGSQWKTNAKLKNFSATVIGDGTVLGKVRLRYEFDGVTGMDEKTPAFAEVDVSLAPGWKHVEIAERHEMFQGDYWEFELSKGWQPTLGSGQPYSGGFGDPPPPKERPLKTLVHKCIAPDLFIHLVPRWNQHFKEGWSFLASDGANQAGAVVVRASRWVWPHDNGIEARVKESGDYAGLRCRTWRGERLWWLAPSAQPATQGYARRYAFDCLDKLNHEFILEWPGKQGGYSSVWPLDGNVNPTGGIRGMGGSAVKNAGNQGNLNTLTDMQSRIHGDAYGSYWNFWSPENPNFFTDFYKVPIALTCQLRSHPRFEELRRLAELKFKEDLYNSVTLPGGAGQECPGYLDHGLGGWEALAPICKQHLGFDPTGWERFGAARQYLNRITQPDGEIRRRLPMGDTHNDKDGPKVHDVSPDEARKWKTIELPGLGVIFQNNAGTPKETYLAFKSGPNRGHFHGEQLAFHYCPHAKVLAPDHHCSYSPRSGQEHMHNRVAFYPDETMPYANMDGYERLIAFKASPGVDVAMGQVESDRLRAVKETPSEVWHQEWPQVPLAKPLVYRRTAVFLKNAQEDYFVFRDQFWAPRKLHAVYCLHVLSDTVEQKGQTVDFGKLTLFCAQPSAFKFSNLPWSHTNGGQESTQGARLDIEAERGEFITVMYPGKPPAMSAIPGGVKVGDDEITFAGTEATAGDATAYVTVRRAGKDVLALTGQDVDLNRFQGEVGLMVPDAGYPFGDIPVWLAKQRAKPAEWAIKTDAELKK